MLESRKGMWRKALIYKSPVLLLLLVSSMLISCDRDDGPDEIPEVADGTFPGVDERLWPYFIRFQHEASERDIVVDLVTLGITGTIEEIEENNVSGLCNFNSRGPNHVMIDLAFWEAAPALFKEFIVFHELGHCALLRDHREGSDQIGICLSIMRSGLDGCNDNYNSVSRTGFLDELFDPAFANDIENR